MQLAKAIGAGILGALAMTFVMVLARLIGMQANMELMLGSMITGTTGFIAWFVGLMMHLVAGACFGIVYAAIFEKVTHRAGAGVGAGIGLVHAVFTGAVLGFMPVLHPMMPEVVPAPGFYLSNLGFVGMIAYFALHVLFGALVGRVYSPVKLKNRRFAHTM